MASYQAAQEKIDRITAVVQKRIAQRPRGAAELRICREAPAKKIRCISYNIHKGSVLVYIYNTLVYYIHVYDE